MYLKKLAVMTAALAAVGATVFTGTASASMHSGMGGSPMPTPTNCSTGARMPSGGMNTGGMNTGGMGSGGMNTGGMNTGGMGSGGMNTGGMNSGGMGSGGMHAKGMPSDRMRCKSTRSVPHRMPMGAPETGGGGMAAEVSRFAPPQS